MSYLCLSVQELRGNLVAFSKYGDGRGRLNKIVIVTLI